LKQQLVLQIKEKRWLDAAHFRDVISRSGEEQSDAISNDATMLSQQSDLKQQLVLAITEKRWLDTAHFCDSISRSGEE
jgi:hypothetical protein